MKQQICMFDRRGTETKREMAYLLSLSTPKSGLVGANRKTRKEVVEMTAECLEVKGIVGQGDVDQHFL